MTTKVNCGQVRGPIQLTFSRSIDPIIPLDVSITRVAVTKEEDAKIAQGEDGEGKGKTTEMGRKAIVPYGLYRCSGFFNPHLAKSTGFNDEDLSIFWEALQGMWDIDRSASRGLMSLRGLYVFSHESALGKAPAHTLFERVQVKRKSDIDVPRSFDDYQITIQGEDPDGVRLHKIVG